MFVTKTREAQQLRFDAKEIVTRRPDVVWEEETFPSDGSLPSVKPAVLMTNGFTLRFSGGSANACSAPRHKLIYLGRILGRLDRRDWPSRFHAGRRELGHRASPRSMKKSWTKQHEADGRRRVKRLQGVAIRFRQQRFTSPRGERSQAMRSSAWRVRVRFLTSQTTPHPVCELHARVRNHPLPSGERVL